MSKFIEWRIRFPPVHEQAAFLIVWLAIAHHVIWGLLVLGWDGQIQATPISILRQIFPDNVLAPCLFIVAGFAMAGLEQMDCDKGCFWKRIGYLLPQQIALMFSAWASLVAILNGHYADLEVRPRSFIAADQSIHILLAMFHTFAVVVIAEIKRYVDR